jgi:hypothetical protein
MKRPVKRKPATAKATRKTPKELNWFATSLRTGGTKGNKRAPLGPSQFHPKTFGHQSEAASR